MKRRCILLLTTLLISLSGCTVERKINLQDLLAQRISSALSAQVYEPDHNKKFYSYYISPQIGRMEGDSTGNILNYEGTRFLMNLNISSIINSRYYKGIEDDSEVLNKSCRKAHVSGKYQDPDGDVHEFSAGIYDLGNQNYLTAIRTDTVDFCSVSDALKAADTAGEMIRIARTVRVYGDAVLSAYSRKETVTFTGEKIQLFDAVAPESGRVEELFDDNDASGDTDEDQSSSTASPSPSPSGE